MLAASMILNAVLAVAILVFLCERNRQSARLRYLYDLYLAARKERCAEIDRAEAFATERDRARDRSVERYRVIEKAHSDMREIHTMLSEFRTVAARVSNGLERGR